MSWSRFGKKVVFEVEGEKVYLVNVGYGVLGFYVAWNDMMVIFAGDKWLEACIFGQCCNFPEANSCNQSFAELL